MNSTLFGTLRGGLIVSCQAPEGSPLRDPYILAKIAKAAEDAGAVAIRAEGVANVEAIKKEVSLPVIGLIKRATNSPIYITPDISDVTDLANSGADIIAVDATGRLREGGVSAAEFLTQAVDAVGPLPIMADIDSVSSALNAERYGASIIGTTLSGYTADPIPNHPDIQLVADITKTATIPLIAEGRYHSAEEVKQALEHGALAVCIGTTLTDPWTLTKRLVAQLQ